MKLCMIRRLLVVFAVGASVWLNCAAQLPKPKKSDPVLTLPIEPVARLRPPALPLPTPHLLRLAAVGDLMLGSWVVDKIRRDGVDYPFDSTRVIIQSADVAIANLEAPFTAGGQQFPDKTYTFRVPPEFSRGVQRAGFDVVTLANNHILDYGCEGLADTRAALDAVGILHSGAGPNRQHACQPVYWQQGETRVAFIGYSFTYPTEFWATKSGCGTCHPSEQMVEETLHQARAQADWVVVSFHWGEEKRTTPKDYQIYFAHLAIDNGADLVLGHHPHVLQGMEVYRNRLIAYSLGNYAFGSYSPSARDSAILKVILDDNGLLYARVIPVSVTNHFVEFQPRILNGAEAARIIADLNRLSAPLNKGRDILAEDGSLSPFPPMKRQIADLDQLGW
ncbi:MAG TPA: CapA family protein [bacterium]|nr:CapA family protein [bacterium]HNT66015.1 CapA family protein [bacterium]